MEKNVKISMLCQIHGELLTEKQLNFLDDYYNNDLSLSEMAENYNITRQAVRDNIKKGENKLLELEYFTKKKFDELVREIKNFIPIHFNSYVRE